MDENNFEKPPTLAKLVYEDITHREKYILWFCLVFSILTLAVIPLVPSLEITKSYIFYILFLLSIFHFIFSGVFWAIFAPRLNNFWRGDGFLCKECHERIGISDIRGAFRATGCIGKYDEFYVVCKNNHKNFISYPEAMIEFENYLITHKAKSDGKIAKFHQIENRRILSKEENILLEKEKYYQEKYLILTGKKELKLNENCSTEDIVKTLREFENQKWQNLAKDREVLFRYLLLLKEIKLRKSSEIEGREN